MSRYLILFILNAPLVVAGLLSTIVSYKLNKVSRSRFIFRLILWVGILLGLIFAKPIYTLLFSHNLTESEPLSLFDVIQITGIVLTYYIASHALTKVDALERRVNDLHQELSIFNSKRK